MKNQNHIRIAIIGTSGSGKSTLAKSLAQKFGIKYIEQDQFFWLPQWQEVPKEQFEKSILKEITADSWVICGNHSNLQKKIWERATHVIWLNYSLSTCLWRGFFRTLKRVFFKVECCNGNKEGFFHAFMSNKSILWWILKTHSKRIEYYNNAKKQGHFSKLNFLEFKRPKDSTLWLNSFN